MPGHVPLFPPKCSFPWRDLSPHLIMVSWVATSPHPRQHFDRFSRFCGAHGLDQQTRTHTHWHRPRYFVRIKQLQEFLKSDHWLQRYCIFSSGVFHFGPPCMLSRSHLSSVVCLCVHQMSSVSISLCPFISPSVYSTHIDLFFFWGGIPISSLSAPSPLSPFPFRPS